VVDKPISNTPSEDWRERRARAFAKDWCANMEPIFAEVYGIKRTEDEVFTDQLRIMSLYETEAQYQEFYIEQGRPWIDRLWGRVKERAGAGRKENQK